MSPTVASAQLHTSLGGIIAKGDRSDTLAQDGRIGQYLSAVASPGVTKTLHGEVDLREISNNNII